ncbi:MFS transporter [Paenibacillus sp. UMB4589-SE434]|uniref:MFS transporter n=1 Tax=Paenibacillus sp. UMB4589-SE434 TaxID=3046314 RepID=UPI00254CC770|nr:MFS transporter [Paenibacillus sp. UMB4589-SE434]MDK8183847.1 MFS transporter [Paenibacillus sp. UMB4589-SE434]
MGRLLKFLQALFYSTNAILIPYLPLLLQERGFNSIETGTLLMLGPFLAMFAQPLAGIISDKLKAARPILIVCWIATGVSSYVLFTSHHHGTMVASLLSLYIFLMPTVSLLDALVVKNASRLGESYSSLRMWGSVGFMITLLVLSQYFEIWGGVYSLTWIFAPIWIGVFLILWVLQESQPLSEPKDNGGAAAESNLNLTAIRKLLADPRLLVFLVFIFILAMPHRMNDALLSIHMQNLGATSGQISWAWAVAGGSEIIGFFVMAKLIRAERILGMLAVSALLYTVRWVLYMYITDPWAIVFLQATHALTYVAVWVLAIEYVTMILPRSMVGTGQAILSMVFLGLGGLAGGSLGGALQQHVGESAMYAMGVVCAGIAALGFYIWTVRNRRTVKEITTSEP